MIADLFHNLDHGVNWQEIDQESTTWQSTKEELRIVMVTPRYYPQRGRIENHVYQIAHRMAQIGHDITVLTSSNHQRLLAQDEMAGVKIQRVAENIHGDSYAAALDFYSAIRYGQWDIVHLQSSHTLIAMLGMYAARQAQIPYVITLHGGDFTSDPQNPLYCLQDHWLRPLLANAARLIAPTPFAIEYYRQRLQLPPEHFILIPEGRDSAAMFEPFAADHEVVIAAVGRLESASGQHRLIAAMPHILMHFPTARLRILGKDLDRRALAHQAYLLGVADHIEIDSLTVADFAEIGVTTADAKVITVSGVDPHYAVALTNYLTAKPPKLNDYDSAKQIEMSHCPQVCRVDTTHTPQEIALSLIEQLQIALSKAHRHLLAWDYCVDELLALYHTLVKTPVRTTTSAATCSALVTALC
jgi:glycogen synthase